MVGFSKTINAKCTVNTTKETSKPGQLGKGSKQKLKSKVKKISIKKKNQSSKFQAGRGEAINPRFAQVQLKKSKKHSKKALKRD